VIGSVHTLHIDERDACFLAGHLIFACFVSPVVTGVGTHFPLGRCMRELH